MKALLGFGLLFLHAALVMPSDAPGKAEGERGLPGLPGPRGVPGHPGPPGDCKNSVCEDLQNKFKAFDEQLKELQTGPQGPQGEIGDCIGLAIENLKSQMTVMDSRIRDLQSKLENQEKVFSFGKEIARSGNKVYIMNTLEVTYDEAKTICGNGGGQLAVPRTQEENQAIFSLRKKVQTHTFIGINDIQREGDFRDLSGQVIGYFNWNQGEPNNLGNNENCLEMWDDGRWNDENCASKRFFICEL